MYCVFWAVCRTRGLSGAVIMRTVRCCDYGWQLGRDGGDKNTKQWKKGCQRETDARRNKLWVVFCRYEGGSKVHVEVKTGQ